MVPDDETVKPSILLVEETLTQAILIQHQLKRAGYTVKLARGGRAALTEIEKEKYGLILCDINMPDMNGYEVCRHIKLQPDLKDIPFIFLSTPMSRTDLLKMLESKGDDFILKTFDEKNFIDKLENIIKTARLRKDDGREIKVVFDGVASTLQAVPSQLADFLLSSFEMYLFEQSRSTAAREEK